jgi:hypothetical protein
LSEKTINNVSVKPIVKYFKLEGYNVYISVTSKSGKTNCLSEMIKRATDKRTCCWIFCPTCKLDPTWISIIEYLENRGNIAEVILGGNQVSIMEGRVNLLDEIVCDLSSPEENKDKNKEDKDKHVVPLTNPIAMYYKDQTVN